jgi:hypothetical protein
MTRQLTLLAAGAVLGAALALHGPAKAASGLGPSEYLCFDTDATTATGDCENKDSPFANLNFLGFFHVEDFQDGALNTPGVSETGANSVEPDIFPPGLTDSVDEDDGAIDGSGNTGGAGRSLFSISGRGGIEFTFDEVELGMLPTHVGIVWTDGRGTIDFEAFDDLGAPIPECTLSGDHSGGIDFTGATDEDRFYGCVNATGISSIMISNGIGGIEVDHLQYGKLLGIKKELTSGPCLSDPAAHCETDFAVAVEAPSDVSLPYDFKILIDLGGASDNVLVKDTAPAEWIVIEIDGQSVDVDACGESDSLTDPDVEVFKGGRLFKKCKSATHIEWMPDPDLLDGSEATFYAATAASNPVGSLYTIDPDGFAVALVGETDDAGDDDIDYALTGLAVEPGTGVLYGATSRNSETAPGSLVTVDPATGDVTLIGSFGLPVSTTGGNCALADISFNSGGVLYGWAEPDSGGCDSLWTVDLGSGAAALVGDPGGATRGSGLAFDSADDLFSCGNCDGWRSSPATLTQVDLSDGSILSETTLTNDIAGRPVGALAFDNLGTLFGTRKGQSKGGDPGHEELIIIAPDGTISQAADLTAGTPILNVDALAFTSSTMDMLRVDMTTRESPGRGNDFFAPTSCGPLYLNDGAQAYDKDTGALLAESNRLVVAAVEDLDGGGIDPTGQGDEDADGIVDIDEVRIHGTNPCDDDSDGDGLTDGDEVDTYGTDPLDDDTDGGGETDGSEVGGGRDPLNPADDVV